MYLDGVLIGQQPDTTGLLSQLANVDQCYIGNSRFADNDYAGLVKNFRIYDKALSAAEIGQLGQEATWKLYYGAAQDSTLTQLQEAVAELTGSLSDAQDDIQQAQEDISALQSDVGKIKNGTTPLPYLSTSGGVMTGDVDMDSHAHHRPAGPCRRHRCHPQGLGRWTVQPHHRRHSAYGDRQPHPRRGQRRGTRAGAVRIRADGAGDYNGGAVVEPGSV